MTTKLTTRGSVYLVLSLLLWTWIVDAYDIEAAIISAASLYFFGLAAAHEKKPEKGQGAAKP